MQAERPSQPLQKLPLVPPVAAPRLPAVLGASHAAEGRGALLLLSYAAWLGSVGEQLELVRDLPAELLRSRAESPRAARRDAAAEDRNLALPYTAPVRRGEAEGSADLVLLSAQLFARARAGVSWSGGSSLLGSAAAQPLHFHPHGRSF